MSKTVDKNVVQMEFDNSKFESNVKQSMSTLDKLKNALKFKGATDGLDNLNKSINSVDFSQLEATSYKAGFHIQDVWLKVSSVFEYQIARKIVSAGERIAKSLSLDQITAGWAKYAQKTTAVQTIMSATTLTWEKNAKAIGFAGTQMDFVTEQLDKLNWFSDETSYSFTDMTSNIGKFTAAGVQLTTAVTAMEGIALWAAKAGQGTNEASRAMYNLAQSLGTGSVKLIDWKSIENANMATQEFKTTVIQTAEELGTLKKTSDKTWKTLAGHEVTVENFNDALKDGWFSSKVLLKSLNEYGKAATLLSNVSSKYDITTTSFLRQIREYQKGNTTLNEIADETRIPLEVLTPVVEKLTSKEYELSMAAFKAGQECKTFQEVIDATADAASTSWLNMFDAIFGNYEEAKELWSALAETMYDTFVAPLEGIRYALRDWHDDGGRADLFDEETGALWNLINTVYELMGPIKEVMSEIFPPITAERLRDFTKGLQSLTEKLKPSERTLQAFKEVLEAIAIPFKIIISIVKELSRFIPSIIVSTSNVIGVLFKLAQIIIRVGKAFVATIVQTEEFQRIITAIIQILKNFKKGINIAFTSILKFFNRGINVKNNSILENFANILLSISRVVLNAVATMLEFIANLDFTKVTQWPGQFYEGLKKLASGSKFLTAILGVLKTFWDVLVNIKDRIVLFFTTFFDELQNVDSIGGFFGALKDAFIVALGIDSEEVIKKFESFKTSIKNIFAEIKELLKDIPWAQIILAGFAVALVLLIVKISSALTAFADLAGSIRSLITTINGLFKGFINFRKIAQTLYGVATLITVVTGALWVISKIPKDQLTGIAVTLGSIAGGMLILIMIMTKLNSASPSAVMATKIMTKSLLLISTSIFMLASALSVLNYALDNTDSYWKSLIALVAIMGALVGVSIALSKWAPNLLQTGTVLIFYAGAIALLSGSLYLLSNTKFKDIDNLCKAIITISISLGLVTALTSHVNNKGILKLFAIAAALRLLAPIIEQLSSIVLSEDAKQILKMISVIIVIISALSLLGSILSLCKPLQEKVNKGNSIIKTITKAMFEIAASLLLISLSLKVLSDTVTKNPTGFLIATGIIAAIVLFFSLLKTMNAKIDISVTSEISKSLLAIAGSIAILSAVVALLSLLKWEDLWPGLLVVAGLLTMIGILIKVANGSKEIDLKGLMQVVGAVAALTAIIAVIAILSSLDPNFIFDILKSLIPLVAILGGIVGSLILLSKFAKDIKTGPLIAFGATAAILIGELIALTLLLKDPQTMLASLAAMLAMSGTLLTLGGSLRIASKNAQGINWQSIIAMVGMAITVGASLILLTALSNDFHEIVAAGIAMSGTLLALAGAMKIVSDVKINWQTTLALAATALSVGIALAMVAKYDWLNIAVACGALSVTIIALAAAAKLAGSSSAGFGTLIALGLAAVLVGSSLAMLAAMPWDQILIAAVAISVVATVFGVLGAVLQGSGIAIATTLIGIGVGILAVTVPITLLAAGIGILVAAFGYLFASLSQFISIAMTALMNADALCAGMLKFANTTSQSIIMIATSIGIGILTIISYVSIGIEKIAEAIGNGIVIISASIAKGIIVIGEIITTGLGHIITDIISFDWLFGNAGSNNAESYTKAVIEEFESPKFKSKASNAVEHQIETLEKSTEPVAENAGKNTASSLFNGLLDSIGNNGEGSKVLDLFKGNLKDNLSDIDMSSIGSLFGIELTSGFASTAIGGINNIIQTIEGKFTKANKNVIVGYDERGFALYEVTEAESKEALALEDVSSLLGINTDKSNELTEALTGGSGGGLSGAAQETKSSFEELGDAIQSGIQGSMSYFDMFEKKEARTKEDILSSMRSQVEGLMSWTKDIVTLGQKGLSQSLLTKLAEDGMNSYDLVQGFLQMTTEELQEANLLYQQELLFPESAKNSIMNSWILSGQQFGQGFANGLDPTAANAVSELLALNALNTLQYTLDEHSPSRKTFTMGENFVRGMSNGIKATPTAINEAIVMGNKVLDALKEKASFKEGKSIGQDLISGLQAGLKDTTYRERLASAAKEVANSIPYWMRRMLDEHSPSKVAIQIGEYFDLGLAKGIENGTDKTVDATKGLADNTIDTMRSAVAKIGAFVTNNVDTQPVIRPVLDLNDLKNGVGQINSLIGTSSLPMGNLGFNYIANAEMQANQNTDIVQAISDLRDDVGSLNQAISNIKVYLDSGTMIGEMIGGIDQSLNRRAIYAGRGI